MKHNRIIAVILLTFIAVWAYLTTQLPESTMIGEPGPKFFPSMILGLMAVLSILLFFVKDKKKETAEVKNDDAEKEMETEKKQAAFPIIDAFKLYAVFLAGIVMMYYIGFAIAMIVALTGMLWMIGWKLFPRAIVFSAVVTLAIYFLFDWLLRIPLPIGKLF
jgi:F0F1-type ATP synthase assembly protein I